MDTLSTGAELFSREFARASRQSIAASSLWLAALAFDLKEGNDVPLFGLRLENLTESKIETSLFIVSTMAIIHFFLKLFSFRGSNAVAEFHELENEIGKLLNVFSDARTKSNEIVLEIEHFSEEIPGKMNKLMSVSKRNWTMVESHLVAYRVWLSKALEEFSGDIEKEKLTLDRCKELLEDYRSAKDASKESFVSFLERQETEIDASLSRNIEKAINGIGDELSNLNGFPERVKRQSKIFYDVEIALRHARRGAGLEKFDKNVFLVSLPIVLFFACLFLFCYAPAKEFIEQFEGFNGFYSSSLTATGNS